MVESDANYQTLEKRNRRSLPEAKFSISMLLFSEMNSFGSSKLWKDQNHFDR